VIKKIICIQALAIVMSCSWCLSSFTVQFIFLLRCAKCKQSTQTYLECWMLDPHYYGLLIVVITFFSVMLFTEW